MASMNYNHLFYFLRVARQGSISAASRELGISQPTISEQLRKLEEDLGTPLFHRVGRGLRLTEAGQRALTYAEKIFQIGREMTESLQGRASSATTRFAVGIARGVHPLVARQLVAPALKAVPNLCLTSIEDHADALYSGLALQRFDILLTNAPMPSTIKLCASAQLLRRSQTSFFGPRATARKQQIPAALNGAPFFMPEANTHTHKALQNWFNSNHIQPKIMGEFSDRTLLETFAAASDGFFAAPAIVERDIRDRYSVEFQGRTRDIVEAFYIVSTERRPNHPAVLAMIEAARRLEHRSGVNR